MSSPPRSAAELNRITEAIIGAAIEIRSFGSGLYPREERVQIRDPEVARRVGEEHGIEPREGVFRQHPLHVVERPAELRLGVVSATAIDP